MSSDRQRTVVVSLLAAAIGVRVSASQPLWDSASVLSTRPHEALAGALDGWSSQGSLGVATAQGVRDLPLALSYTAADVVGLAPIVVQTIWRALLLVLAVVGAVRLARTVADRTDRETATDFSHSWAPWVAAIFYGCSALVVATAARHPLDGIAAASLPWAIHPLMKDRVGWRPAAASALWVGVAGFGSPPWAFAVMLSGLITAVLLARSDVRQTLRWVAVAVPASGWWVFLAVWESVHGTDIAALFPDRTLTSHLASAIGFIHLTTPVVIVVAVAPLGVVAASMLLRPPGNDTALVGALAGVSMLTAALLASGAWVLPTFASGGPSERGLLLGPSLSLLALACLLAWVPVVRCVSERMGATTGRARLLPRSIAATLAIVLVALSNMANLAAATQERSEVPPPGSASLWTEVAAWSESAPSGRVLVLPAVEGHRSQRLAARALGDRAWVARDALPTSGSPATRALDDLVSRLIRGEHGPAVQAGLERLGISYVLLRDDLPPGTARPEHNALTRAALVDAGARLLRRFVDPDPDAAAEDLADFGVLPSAPQIELWALQEAPTATLYPGPPLRVLGGVSAVGGLDDLGVMPGRPVRLVPDIGDVPPAVVSDSPRRRDVDLRVPVDPVGPTLPADEQPVVVPDDAAPLRTSPLALDGAASVSASSSAADLDGDFRNPSSHVLSAVDGNVFTAWESRRGTGFGEWWQITFDRPTVLQGGSVTFKEDVFTGHDIVEVRVDTDQASYESDVVPGVPLTLRSPTPVKRLRLTVTRVSTWTRPSSSVGITEVDIPGVSIRDDILVTGAGSADWLLTSLPGSSHNCVPATGNGVGTRPGAACDRGLSVPGADSGDLNRVLRNEVARQVRGVVLVRAGQSEAAGSLADELAEATVTASASSVVAPDLATRAQSAVDADPTTAWRPAPDDASPSLELRWDRPAEVSGLRFDLGDPQLSSVPTTVRVSTGDGIAVVRVDSAGRVDFPTVRTRFLDVEFLDDTGLTTVDTFTGGTRHVPIAVHEVALVGGPEIAYDKDVARDLACGTGPPVSVAGESLQSRLTVAANEILEGSVVRAEVCRPVRLPVADVPVQVPASFRWTPLGLLLQSGPPDQDPAGGSARKRLRMSSTLLTDPSTTERVSFGAATDVASTVVLAVPSGTGWTARAGGSQLSPTTVDGWAQAWLVPAGASSVDFAYPPARSLRLGLAAGGLAWLSVLTGWLLSAVPTSGRRRRSSGVG